jgi:hypothetical protein
MQIKVLVPATIKMPLVKIKVRTISKLKSNKWIYDSKGTPTGADMQQSKVW